MTNRAEVIRQRVQAQYPGAIVVKRTKTSITHVLGNGEFLFIGHIAPLHKGTSNFTQADEIDSAWEDAPPADAPWLKKRDKADFISYFGPGADAFDSGYLVQYEHPPSGLGIRFQPRQLVWTNDLDDIEVIASPQNVAGIVSDNTITFAQAYGPGLHFGWELTATAIRKQLKVQNMNSVTLPSQSIKDGGNVMLAVPFSFEITKENDVIVDGVVTRTFICFRTQAKS